MATTASLPFYTVVSLRMWEEEYLHGGGENWDGMTKLNFRLFAGAWLKTLHCGFVQYIFMLDKLQLQGILFFLDTRKWLV